MEDFPVIPALVGGSTLAAVVFAGTWLLNAQQFQEIKEFRGFDLNRVKTPIEEGSLTCDAVQTEYRFGENGEQTALALYSPIVPQSGNGVTNPDQVGLRFSHIAFVDNSDTDQFVDVYQMPQDGSQPTGDATRLAWADFLEQFSDTICGQNVRAEMKKVEIDGSIPFRVHPRVFCSNLELFNPVIHTASDDSAAARLHYLYHSNTQHFMLNQVVYEKEGSSVGYFVNPETQSQLPISAQSVTTSEELATAARNSQQCQNILQ